MFRCINTRHNLLRGQRPLLVPVITFQLGGTYTSDDQTDSRFEFLDPENPKFDFLPAPKSQLSGHKINFCKFGRELIRSHHFIRRVHRMTENCKSGSEYIDFDVETSNVPFSMRNKNLALIWLNSKIFIFHPVTPILT